MANLFPMKPVHLLQAQIGDDFQHLQYVRLDRGYHQAKSPPFAGLVPENLSRGQPASRFAVLYAVKQYRHHISGAVFLPAGGVRPALFIGVFEHCSINLP